MPLALYGNEFVVSTIVQYSTTHADYAGAATALANGGFALTYVSFPNQTYQARVYGGFGASTAGPAGIGTINGGVSYQDGGIAELTSGRLVETFSESGPAAGDSIDVAVTSFLPNLTGFSAVANPGPNGPAYQFGFQFNPTLASSKLGGYMVVWDDDATSYGRPGTNVIAQVFDNNGVAVGPAFVASEPALSNGNQLDPDVGRILSGGYVVAWQDDSGLDGGGSGIRARIFSSSGTAATAEKAVNQAGAGNQTNPAVAGLTGGGFVVAWEDAGRIEARVFNASGAAVTGDLTIAQFAAGTKTAPDITALADGGFLVTWTTDATAPSNGGDGSGTAVKARAFSATGAATSGEILVNSVTTGNQRNPTVATLADGRVIVSWTDESGALNSGYETRAQILDPRTTGVDVTGTAGVDRYVGSAFDDVLRGGGGNDQIYAGSGNDTLDGGAGADNMQGVAGNDAYVVDNAGDVVNEGVAGSGGTDTVRTSLSFSLADTVHVKGSVENLTLIGAGNINGTGNALANTIAGNAASNTLIGGLGADSFLFNTALDKTLNVDALTDFSPIDDTILLDNAIFKKLKTEGVLKGKFFEKGKKADDGNDYIIFNPKNDTVSYDKNGDKQGGVVKFAVLPDGVDLSKADFFVV